MEKGGRSGQRERQINRKIKQRLEVSVGNLNSPINLLTPNCTAGLTLPHTAGATLCFPRHCFNADELISWWKAKPFLVCVFEAGRRRTSFNLKSLFHHVFHQKKRSCMNRLVRDQPPWAFPLTQGTEELSPRVGTGGTHLSPGEHHICRERPGPHWMLRPLPALKLRANLPEGPCVWGRAEVDPPLAQVRDGHSAFWTSMKR